MSEEEKPKTCIIYLLKNTKPSNNGNYKVYVGQTWRTLKERMFDGKGYKNSIYLWNAIQKYGFDSFEYEILEECDSQEKADELEIKYIKQYNSQDPDIGYNLKDGGSHGLHSKATKLKISETLKEIGYWRGQHLPQETRDKISQTKLDMHLTHTDEWKENNSKFMIERHKTDGHPMLGKHHTEEAKQKISEAGKGRIVPKEVSEKISKKLQKSEALQNEVIRLYNEGKLGPEIKKLTGAKHIYRIFERHGITLRLDPVVKDNRTVEILQLTEQGKTKKEISKELKVSLSTVTRAVRNSKKPEPIDSEDKVSQILELYKINQDRDLICEKLNVSKRFVAKTIKKNSPEEDERLRVQREQDLRIFNLYEQTKSRKVVAKEFKISTITVGRALDRINNSKIKE